MVNLNDFEKYLDPVILKRGKDYYKKGAVSSLEQTSDTKWLATVEGTEEYEVEVEVEGKQVIDCSCNCPYDGEMCKHVVATLLALRDDLKKSGNAMKTEKRSKNVFTHLLQTLTVKEFQDFMKAYAAANKNFRTEFELYFAQKDERIDVGQKYDELINKLISKYSRRGYIEYKNASILGKEISKLLKQGTEFMRQKNYLDAFSLADVALKNLIEVFRLAEYDEPSSLYTATGTAIDLFTSIATLPDVASDLKLKLFNHLRTLLLTPEYGKYGDISEQLEKLYQNMALDLHRHDAFLGYLDEKLKKVRPGSYLDYEARALILGKISFLEKIGRNDEAEKLVMENLAIPEFRRRKVGEAISLKDFATAKKLLTEGIKLAEAQGYPGIVSEWEYIILKIAELENDVRVVRELSKKFTFDRGFSKEYYKKWKATYAPAEWKPLIDSYINRELLDIQQRLKSERYLQYIEKYLERETLSRLAPVFIEEGYLNKVMELVVKIDVLNVTYYYLNFLKGQYPDELQAMLVKQLQEYGEQASSRTDYGNLADVMKTIIEEIPASGKAVKAVAQNLIDQFPRKPALKEVMLKVLNL